MSRRRHPRSICIYHTPDMIIDCGSIDHAAIQQPNDDDKDYYVLMSFRNSGKTTKVRFQDHEGAVMMMSRLMRGMIAAATGDFSVTRENWDVDDDEETGDNQDARR